MDLAFSVLHPPLTSTSALASEVADAEGGRNTGRETSSCTAMMGNSRHIGNLVSIAEKAFFVFLNPTIDPLSDCCKLVTKINIL